jgi:hypothetical protein
MTGHGLQVVQFVHPGFEYHGSEYVGGRSTRSGVMGWKPGLSRHDRKFMLTRGSVLDCDTGRDHASVPIVFWGEWEGPSVFWKLNGPPGKPMPSIIHAPFRPAHCPIVPIQNTDPMVFGDAFVYSNCLQNAYRSLRTLGRGSIVLFGRHARVNGQRSFSLDTCLVIDRVETLAPVPIDVASYTSDLLTDVVLSPLHTEGAVDDLTVYFGQRRSPERSGPFSFFPARPASATMPLFARPQISAMGPLHGVISPENMQGIKTTSGLSVEDRDAIWEEVVRQLAKQDCGLGYHAEPPPVLSALKAENATRHGPLALAT